MGVSEIMLDIIAVVLTAQLVGGAPGCHWDPLAPLFLQQEEEGALPWSFTLGEPSTVPNVLGWPEYNWMPDGHISSMFYNDSGAEEWVVFYPNSKSYRGSGESPLPELQEALVPRHEVLGGKIEEDVYNNGGEWLDAVHTTGVWPQQTLTGFVHAEDHFWSDGQFNGHGKAWKSISLVCSEDRGITWERQGQILTEGTKPPTPDWSGIGDFDVIWDWQSSRWFLLASGLRVAVTHDRGAGSGWQGWDGSGFSANSSNWVRLKDSDGHPLPNGEHPNIHWNRFVRQWIMVWNGYDGRSYISSASRLADRAFQPARVLLEKETEEQVNWYPNLLSESLGDRLGGEHLHLYWRLFPQGLGSGGSIFRKTSLSFNLQQP